MGLTATACQRKRQCVFCWRLLAGCCTRDVATVPGYAANGGQHRNAPPAAVRQRSGGAPATVRKAELDWQPSDIDWRLFCPDGRPASRAALCRRELTIILLAKRLRSTSERVPGLCGLAPLGKADCVRRLPGQSVGSAAALRLANRTAGGRWARSPSWQRKALRGVDSVRLDSGFYLFPAPTGPGQLRRLTHRMGVQLAYTLLNSSLLHPAAIADFADCSRQTTCLGLSAATRLRLVPVISQLPAAAASAVCSNNRSQAAVPEHCPACNASYADCVGCVADPGCEWHSGMAMCVRRGRFPTAEVAGLVTACPAMCEQLSNCSVCLASAGCVWSAATNRCLPQGWVEQLDLLSVQSPWSDLSADAKFCQDCSSRTLCTDLPARPAHLQLVLLAWPSLILAAACLPGGRLQSHRIGLFYLSAPVDECALGLATDCHPNATCTDLPSGYKCVCNPGFVGNGSVCTRVCHPPARTAPGAPASLTTAACARSAGPGRTARRTAAATGTPTAPAVSASATPASTEPPASRASSAAPAGFYRPDTSSPSASCLPCQCHGYGAPPELCKQLHRSLPLPWQHRRRPSARPACRASPAVLPTACPATRSAHWISAQTVTLLADTNNNSSWLIGQANALPGSCYALPSSPPVSLLIRVTFYVPCLAGAVAPLQWFSCAAGLAFHPSLLTRWCGTPSAVTSGDFLAPAGTAVSLVFESNTASSNFTALFAAIQCPDAAMDTGHPPRLYGHSLTRCGDYLYLYGGMDPRSGSAGGISNQLWRADLSSMLWSNLTDRLSSPLPGLYLHRAACHANDTLVIVAGRASPQVSSPDSYIFLLNTSSMQVKSMPMNCLPSRPQLVGFDMSLIPEPPGNSGLLFKLYIIGGIFMTPSYSWEPAETSTGPLVVSVYSDRCHVARQVWPKPMAFHSLVSIGDYLLLHGAMPATLAAMRAGGGGGFVYGRARNWLYSVRCNQWLPLANDTVLVQATHRMSRLLPKVRTAKTSAITQGGGRDPTPKLLHGRVNGRAGPIGGRCQQSPCEAPLARQRQAPVGLAFAAQVGFGVFWLKSVFLGGFCSVLKC
uniref:EGF-like domain-containing protein n=1 Tax=Macrostomum lignano TaxID=282301 RepID=A0A1I8FKC3_9PLAT